MFHGKNKNFLEIISIEKAHFLKGHSCVKMWSSSRVRWDTCVASKAISSTEPKANMKAWQLKHWSQERKFFSHTCHYLHVKGCASGTPCIYYTSLLSACLHRSPLLHFCFLCIDFFTTEVCSFLFAYFYQVPSNKDSLFGIFRKMKTMTTETRGLKIPLHQ